MAQDQCHCFAQLRQVLQGAVEAGPDCGGAPPNSREPQSRDEGRPGVEVAILRSDDADYRGQVTLRHGEGVGTVLRIGRSHENQVRASLHGVSVFHAEIRLAEEGPSDPHVRKPPFRVRDLSMNGTGMKLFPSGEKVVLPKGIDAPLPNGARLMLPMKTKKGRGDEVPEDTENRVYVTVSLVDEETPVLPRRAVAEAESGVSSRSRTASPKVGSASPKVRSARKSRQPSSPRLPSLNDLGILMACGQEGAQDAPQVSRSVSSASKGCSRRRTSGSRRKRKHVKRGKGKKERKRRGRSTSDSHSRGQKRGKRSRSRRRRERKRSDSSSGRRRAASSSQEGEQGEDADGVFPARPMPQTASPMPNMQMRWPGHAGQWPWAMLPRQGYMGGLMPNANVEFCKQQIRFMYYQFKPSKLRKLDAILDKNRGNEYELLQKLCSKYMHGVA